MIMHKWAGNFFSIKFFNIFLNFRKIFIEEVGTTCGPTFKIFLALKAYFEGKT